MTHYLIDYENVNEAGLDFLSDKAAGNVITVFFTSTQKVTLSVITRLQSSGATIEFEEVPAGKQSLDTHLITYLGYVIGDGNAKEIVILSNDNDYDKIIAYWTGKFPGISVRKQQVDTKKATAKRSAVKKESTVLPKPGESPVSDTNTHKKSEPGTDLRKSGDAQATDNAKNSRTKNTQAEAVSEPLREPARNSQPQKTQADSSESRQSPGPVKQTQQRTSEQKKSQQGAAKKPPEQAGATRSASPYSSAKQENGADSTVTAAANALWANGTAPDKITVIANIITDNFGKKDFKSIVYRSLIKEFRQTEGLELYNIIKKQLD